MKHFCFPALACALLAGMTSVASAGTPVLFTTNEVVDGVQTDYYGPYRVQYITVYVDGVKKCYTESNGACTSSDLTQAPWPYTGSIPGLAPGLHTVAYVWATCNNPNSCPHRGEVTQYIDVPDQATQYAVRIPTAKVRFNAPYGIGIGLNKVHTGWALGGSQYTGNVMSGCYTTDYHLSYGQPVPSWPTLPADPEDIDAKFLGFDQVCIGSSDTYPTPTATDPHVVIPYPF